MKKLIQLSWVHHKVALTNIISKFRDSNTFCDVTISCNGNYFPVHRLILSTFSEYFREILEMTPCRHPFIVVQDAKLEDLKDMLDFIYGGEVSIASERLPSFLKAAKDLKVKGLGLMSANESQVPDYENKEKVNDLEEPNATDKFASDNANCEQRRRNERASKQVAKKKILEDNLNEKIAMKEDANIRRSKAKFLSLKSKKQFKNLSLIDIHRQRMRLSKQVAIKKIQEDILPNSLVNTPSDSNDPTTKSNLKDDAQKIDNIARQAKRKRSDKTDNAELSNAKKANMKPASSMAINKSNVKPSSLKYVNRNNCINIFKKPQVVLEKCPQATEMCRNFVKSSIYRDDAKSDSGSTPSHEDGANGDLSDEMETDAGVDDNSLHSYEDAWFANHNAYSAREIIDANRTSGSQNGSASWLPLKGRKLPAKRKLNIKREKEERGGGGTGMEDSDDYYPVKTEAFENFSDSQISIRIAGVECSISEAEFEKIASVSDVKLLKTCNRKSKKYSKKASKIGINKPKFSTKKKKFLCKFCSHKTTTGQNLRLHMRTHTGEKPFVCSYCSYKSTQKIALTKHMQTHAEKTLLQCEQCPYTTTKSYFMEEHKKTHAVGKLYNCALCPFMTKRYQSLKIHLGKHLGKVNDSAFKKKMSLKKEKIKFNNDAEPQTEDSNTKDLEQNTDEDLMTDASALCETQMNESEPLVTNSLRTHDLNNPLTRSQEEDTFALAQEEEDPFALTQNENLFLQSQNEFVQSQNNGFEGFSLSQNEGLALSQNIDSALSQNEGRSSLQQDDDPLTLPSVPATFENFH